MGALPFFPPRGKIDMGALPGRGEGGTTILYPVRAGLKPALFTNMEAHKWT